MQRGNTINMESLPYGDYLSDETDDSEGPGSAVCENTGTYICFGQDLDNIENCHKALTNQDQLIKSLFETTSAYVAYLDKDLNFIKVNRLYADAGGHPAEYYTGKNHFDLYPYVDNEKLFRRVVETGKPLHFSAKPFEYVEFPDKGVTYWDWDLIPVKDDTGKVIGLVFLLNDVTAQKHAQDLLRQSKDSLEEKVKERTAALSQEILYRREMEEELKLAKEKAEQANLAKNEYIANMSHELRTPLSVILSTIQFYDYLLKNNPAQHVDKLMQHTKYMKQNCYRLLRLVNNLIDTTKIDANYYEINYGYYDIVYIVKTILTSISDYLQVKDIKLTFQTNVKEKIIACDIDMIERIFLNLLSNAVKFTEKDGEIQVSIADRENDIEISVKDNGIGIPEDKQSYIFERYRQADELLTRRHEGSGIGLALVKSLVEMLEGTISLESKVGSGSKFTVILPHKHGSITNEQTVPSRLLDRSLADKITVEFSDIYT
jgi:PAS domain S-box-containing protein